MRADRACHGERTLTDGEFEECLNCGTRVRWDLTNDPFWGFSKTCPDAPKPLSCDATAQLLANEGGVE